MKSTNDLSYAGSTVWDVRSEEHLENGSQLVRKWIHEFLPFMLDNEVTTVLDLGCGLGYDSIIMAEYGLEVLGIDHSEVAVAHAIETAQARNVQVSFQQGDAGKPLSVPDAAYDAVFSNMVLHSFPANVLLQVVAEIARCLRPGGYLMFTANSLDDMPVRTAAQAPAVLLDKNFYELAGGQTMHFLSEEFVREMLTDWEIITLQPLASKDEDGNVIKYFWKCIARKTVRLS